METQHSRLKAQGRRRLVLWIDDDMMRQLNRLTTERVVVGDGLERWDRSAVVRSLIRKALAE